MKKLKNVSTKDLDRKQVKPTLKKAKGITTHDLGRKKTSLEYIAENLDALSKKDIEKLKLKIQKIIESRSPTFWKCDSCGFVIKSGWDAEKTTCLSCNPKNYQDGSWMRKMNDKEIEKHLEDEKKRMKEWAEKSFKIEFENTNRYLRSIGEKPYTEEEFRKRKGYKN
jgi:Fe-S-cluster-containing dehydrogenase component